MKYRIMTLLCLMTDSGVQGDSYRDLSRGGSSLGILTAFLQ